METTNSSTAGNPRAVKRRHGRLRRQALRGQVATVGAAGTGDHRGACEPGVNQATDQVRDVLDSGKLGGAGSARCFPTAGDELELAVSLDFGRATSDRCHPPAVQSGELLVPYSHG